MRVITQSQSKMPNIINAINSLGLTAQYRFIDCCHIGGASRGVENLIEMMRAQYLSHIEIGANGLGQLGKIGGFFRVWRVMNAKHAEFFCRNQPVCRRHIGGDHKIFNQALCLVL